MTLLSGLILRFAVGGVLVDMVAKPLLRQSSDALEALHGIENGT